VFVHSTNNVNKIQTWLLVSAIAVVIGLNLAMTSYLTTQSLSEKPIEVALDRLAPAEIEDFTDTSSVESTLSDIAEDRYSTAPVAVRRPAPPAAPRFVARALPPAERFIAPSKPLFEPRIIRIPKPAPPVTFSEPSRNYIANIEYKQQPMSARVVSRKHDSFLAKMIKKPWHFIKAVASKLN
jgi:hypothetical protein